MLLCVAIGAGPFIWISAQLADRRRNVHPMRHIDHRALVPLRPAAKAVFPASMPAEGAGPSRAPWQTMRAHQRRDPLAATIPQRSSLRYPLQIAWIPETQRPGLKLAATDGPSSPHWATRW